MTLSHDPRWSEFRQQMPVSGHWAFFDSAAVSPLTGPARDAVAAWLAEATEQGGTAWLHWERQVDQLRYHAAQMLGATTEEIALVRSTTDGVTLAAEGFPWQAGDNLVVPADEFPTNQYGWMNLVSRGVEVRRVPTEQGGLDLNRLEGVCDSRTRIVALSWVGYLTGLAHRFESGGGDCALTRGAAVCRCDSRTGGISARRAANRHRFSGRRRPEVDAGAGRNGIVLRAARTII